MTYLSADSKAAIALVQEHRPTRVWLLTFGRDRTRDVVPQELINWLQQNYRLTLEQGYVKQDPVYRQVKEHLLHRPAYEYKLTVQMYMRP